MTATKVTIDFDPSSVKNHISQGYNIVAVDVLRATSSIIVALAQGAKKIVPCAEIEEAKQYKKTEDAIIIGERNGEMIPGFDFTNSPADLSQEDLTGKLVAITTTTGTRVITECLGAKHILIGSTINAQAVSKEMHSIGGDWAVIGAGTRGEFRPEDQVGCALIVHYYSQLTNAHIDSKTEEIIKTHTKNVEVHILNSASTKSLTKLGRKADVDFVLASLNRYAIVPKVEYKQGERLIIKG